VIVGGWRGPGWQMFAADPGRGKEVRDWVRHVIDSHDCPVDLDDVILAVGELFANAVTYGPTGGQVLVGYCLWRRGARIVVCDEGGPGVPRVRESSGPAETVLPRAALPRAGGGCTSSSRSPPGGARSAPGRLRSYGAISASRCALRPPMPGRGCTRCSPGSASARLALSRLR
jgi:anti-sigma regulatory factor (Ser/Thr protein kinase)